MAVLIWVILILNLLAFVHHWYWQYEWFDIPMHFLGGFWLSGMLVWLFMKGDTIFCARRFPCVAGIILGAFAVGVGWEMFEFGLDTFIMFNMNDVADTLTDLLMDFLGAVTAYFLFAFRASQSLSTLTVSEDQHA